MFSILDPLTRRWWRAVGRRIDLDGEHRWLDAPTTAGPTVGDGWLHRWAERTGGTVQADVPGAGLLTDLAVLDGPGFRSSDLDSRVRDFYTATAAWRLEVWAGWSPLFWPAGELIARLFGRRVQQLAIPTRALEVARGMTSTVSVITAADGSRVAAAWLRRLRSTGEWVYSGCYSHRLLPGADRPSVHVAFPLQQGNVQVFLRPEVGADGSLWLRSPGERFGGDGCYVVVEDGPRRYAARPALRETFHVYADEEGVLRTDHELRLWRAAVVRLHYKLEPEPGRS